MRSAYDADAVLMRLAERIRALRTARQLRQYQLAQLLDLSPQLINAYELGKIDLPCSRLVQLAEALGVTPGALLDPAPAGDEVTRLAEALRVALKATAGDREATSR